MLPHHAETIRRATEYFRRQPDVIGLLLGGSVAHGFASAESDVDVMIVVSDDDFARRMETQQTCFASRELAEQPSGYVDGKYVAASLLREVAERGSEPARFAFQNARVLFDATGRLAPLVGAAARYPRDGKLDRIRRFQAQFEAWHWYSTEAARRRDDYLTGVAVSKLVLFGGRIVLAHNERLYPYHKWFLRVLSTAPDKPDGLVEAMQELVRTPASTGIAQFAAAVREFRSWDLTDASWPPLFMKDSELNWRWNSTPVEDL